MKVALVFAAAFYLFATGRALLRLINNRPIGRTLHVLTAIGFGFHTLALLQFTAATGHVPFTTQHEILFLVGWCTISLYLILHTWMPMDQGALFLLPLVIVQMILFLFLPEETTGVKPPIGLGLKTHLALLILAYAALGIGWVGGLMYLIQERQLRKQRVSRFLRFFPPLESLESMHFQCTLAGFLLLVLAMIGGMFWHKEVHGTWLAFNLKIGFSFLVIASYGAVLGARRLWSYRGRPAVFLSSITFVLLMVFLLVANLLSNLGPL
jgi:ABC-type uncharacterized transport system permease subunit